MKMRDLIGKRFGRLLVVGYAGRGSQNKHQWKCVCDCGNESLVLGINLTCGRTKSCGCFLADILRIRSMTHGETSGGKTTEYVIWSKIKGRCFNETDAAFWMYGARGITMCQRWSESFPSFLEDVGHRPKGLSIDRKDNNSGYTCGKCDECVKNGWKMNVRWATPKQQCNNRRSTRFITIGNETKSMSEWADAFGVSPQLVWSRIHNGWTPEMLAEKYLTKIAS